MTKHIHKFEFYYTVNERLLGTPRPGTRPKSTTVINLQNRTLLDIRSIQPPSQTPVTYFIQLIIIY